MEFKGTKGKWEYEGGDNHSIDIILPNDTTITIDRQSRYTGEYVTSREEMQHNALLISKTPEMLEAMQEFCDRVDHGEVRSINTYNKFKAIIKSATEL